MSRTVCFWGTKKYSCTLDDNKKQKCGDVFEFSNRHLLLFCILIPLYNSATLYVSHHVRSMTNFYFHFFMRVFSIERSPQPLMKYEIIILSLSLSLHPLPDSDGPGQVVASGAFRVRRVLKAHHRRIVQSARWPARLLPLLRIQVHWHLPRMQPADFGGKYFILFYYYSKILARIGCNFPFVVLFINHAEVFLFWSATGSQALSQAGGLWTCSSRINGLPAAAAVVI